MTPLLASALLPAADPAHGPAGAVAADPSADFAASLELARLALTGDAPPLQLDAPPATRDDEPAEPEASQSDALALLLAGLVLPGPATPTARPPAPETATASLSNPSPAAAAAGGDLLLALAEAPSVPTAAKAVTDEPPASLRAAAADHPRTASSAQLGALAPPVVAADGAPAAGILLPAAPAAGPADVRAAAGALAAAADVARQDDAAALPPEVARPAGGVAARPPESTGDRVALAAVRLGDGEAMTVSEPAAPAGGAAPGVAPATATAAPGVTPAAAHGAPPAAAHVPVPVGHEEWGAALARQIVRVGPQREVELHLNPAELGPLHVKLSLGDRQAQILFVSEHAAVRQALEAALPQLRSTFADSGISLGQATVGSGAGDTPAQQGGGQQARPGRDAQPAEQRTDQPARIGPAAGGSGRAVDTFA